MSDINKPNTTDITGTMADGTVNTSTSNFNLSVHREGLNIIAAASSTGGAALGYKVAHITGGNYAVRIIAGLASMGVVQTGTAIMSNILNKNNQLNNSNKNNFISDFIRDNEDLKKLYPEFPLNLLPEMNKLINIELFFMFVLFNLFLVNMIMKIDYKKYIPNNIIGKFLDLLIKTVYLDME